MVFLTKEMRVGEVDLIDKHQNGKEGKNVFHILRALSLSVEEASVRTFHFLAESVLMANSTGKAVIPQSERHPTLTVEVKATRVKRRRNIGFNEIIVLVEE